MAYVHAAPVASAVASFIGADMKPGIPGSGSRLASGTDYLATIEPWHGFQVVVYTRPASTGAGAQPSLWQRTVIDEQLKMSGRLPRKQEIIDWLTEER